MSTKTEIQPSSGMKTIGVVGLASLSFLLILSAMGQANEWLARVVIVGSMLMWAIMTWYIYQRD